MNTLLNIPLSDVLSISFGDNNLHDVVPDSLTVDAAGTVTFRSTSIVQGIAIPLSSIDYVLYQV